MKVVINKCYGGFSLSHKAIMEYAKLKGFKLYPFVEKRDKDGNLLQVKDKSGTSSFRFESYKGGKAFIVYYSKKPLNKDGTYDGNLFFSPRDMERNDPALIKVVEKLGEKANGNCAELSIIEIPDGSMEWTIEEYDGIEHIAEKHRTWG